VVDLADREPTAFQRAQDAVRSGGGMTKFPATCATITADR
jgi:hypothetical protein